MHMFTLELLWLWRMHATLRKVSPINNGGYRHQILQYICNSFNYCIVTTRLKWVSSSYFNVFGILIFVSVIPLHPNIPKIKNSDGGGTLISDILTQMLEPLFSLEIQRKLPYFVFFATKSL